MITLAAADTLAGIAQTASTVTCTIFGMELSGSTEVYKVLYQGQLGSSAATVYTVPSSTVAFVKSIHIVNTSTTVSKTFQLFRGGTAQSNALTAVVTLQPSGWASYNDEGWQFHTSSGQVRISQVVPRVFNVRDFGAIGNGTTDDTAAIQNAIDTCAAEGGGTVSGTLHSVTSTIVQQHSNVFLDFGMQAHGMGAVESGTTWDPFVGWSPENVLTGLIWDGADGGTMVSITPSWGDAANLHTSITGVGFRGSLIAGRSPFTTAANVGLYISGVAFSEFPAIFAYEFKTYGVQLQAENRTSSHSPSVFHNHFGMIAGRQLINSGSVLILDGFASVGNPYINKFDVVNVYHDVGYGIEMKWCDHNVFDLVHLTRPAASSQTTAGLRFARSTVDNQVPRWNLFRTVSVDYSSVVSEGGTTLARSPKGNQIDQYTNDQGPNAAPTIEALSELRWREDEGRTKSLGDYAISVLEFEATNVAASQTAKQMSYGNSTNTVGTERLTFPYSGILMGISVRGTTTTAGTISFIPTIAGVQQTSSPILSNLAAGAILTTNGASNTIATGVPFSAGQSIGVDIATNSAFLPTTNVYKVLLWIAVAIK